jgi:ArsR family transcriptional regulator
MTPQELARLCKALGSESRVKLFDLIIRHNGTLCVLELEDSLIEAGYELTQPTISYHLTILRDAGLVDYRKRGLYEFYFVLPEALVGLSEALRDYVRMGSREVLV